MTYPCRVQAAAEAARELAREAGALARRLQGQVAVRDKGGDLGPVTEADLAVEELLLARLRAAFPATPVLSEETRPQIELPASFWCVDPIDGTREYVKGLPEFAVQIGLIAGGLPVAGACAFGDGRLAWGWEDGGCFLEEEGAVRQVRLAPLTELRRATAVHSRRHAESRLFAALDRLGIHGRIPAGSVGYKVSLLLRGRAHLYLHTSGGANWWDSAAPAALVRAAGGTATDTTGAPLRYESERQHRRGMLFAVPGLGAVAATRLAGN